MALRIKTKVFFGLTFLFILVILMGSIGAYSIYNIAAESKEVLKDNYESVQHARQMLQLLDEMKNNPAAPEKFALILEKQERNITEAGEKQITEQLKDAFTIYTRQPDTVLPDLIRKDLYEIMDLNMQAITQKNEQVQEKSIQLLSYLALTGTFCLLLSLSFIFNFPSYIANPINKLTAGIRQIANKNYTQRLHFSSEDEFGELADAFNAMAEQLDGYENSNLAKIMFEKKRIETIINQMNDAIIGFDKKRNILFMNRVAEQLFDLKEAEIIDQPAEQVASKNELLKKILNEKNLSADMVVRRNRKDSFFRKESFHVMNESEMIGEVILLKNITAHKELDIAKTHFIATVSHELKTPISSIKISSDLLEDERVGETNEEQKSLIRNIREDADRLLKITAELLDRTQAETGKIQLQIREARPEEIVEYAVNAVSQQAEQKKIQFEVLYTGNISSIEADKEKTAWVLVNLLSNAIRYSPDYGKIIIEVKEKGNKTEFSVKDFGKGIDSKYKEKIFDRYFQVPESNKTGTGLGLAISREFIEAQRGEIHVESEAGSGCKFIFSI